MKPWVILVTALLAARTANAQGTFEDEVRPILQNTCFACHNEEEASGDLNLKPLDRADSIASNREDWEKILAPIESRRNAPAQV